MRAALFAAHQHRAGTAIGASCRPNFQRSRTLRCGCLLRRHVDVHARVRPVVHVAATTRAYMRTPRGPTTALLKRAAPGAPRHATWTALSIPACAHESRTPGSRPRSSRRSGRRFFGTAWARQGFARKLAAIAPLTRPARSRGKRLPERRVRAGSRVSGAEGKNGRH
jgi:hypothetical protein